MTKQVQGQAQASSVTSVTRRLALRKLGTSGLVLVGGGIAAWQAYTALTNNSNNNEIGFCGGAGMIRRPLTIKSKALVKEEETEGPEYVTLSAAAAERLVSSPPDLVEAKEELKSVLLPKHMRKSWKLLRQANWADYETHLKATRDLAKMSRGLGDGECRQLAQSSHRRTAVGLARTDGVDLRMLTPPPPLPVEVTSASIPELFRKVLSSLPSGDDKAATPVPECVSFFTDNALKTYVPGADDELIRDTDLDLEFNRESHHMYRIPRKRYSEKVLTEYCLHALLSHSTLKAHAIIMASGICLPALARVAREYGKEHPRIVSLVGKIVANIAMHEETHDALFATGWVNLLAGWKQNPNLLVTLPATKALSNMDQAFSGGEVFQPGIYLMLPEDRNVRYRVTLLFCLIYSN